MSRRTHIAAVAFCAVIAAAPQGHAATITTDFAFGFGSPFEGSTVASGVGLTLTTTETEPFGFTSFRDLTTGEDATVSFSFERPVRQFSLDVSRVRADEFLTAFSIGLPDAVTGDLAVTPDGVSTLNAGDFNAGSLVWTGLNTDTINFVIATADGAALSVDSISFDVEPAVIPLPASAGLLGLGLLALGAAGRRRT
ncbi:MAG: VPLPA-CTERM sorting domain-containing protein [Pseudomonadota bacterium]